jgi:hypothetical protein
MRSQHVVLAGWLLYRRIRGMQLTARGSHDTQHAHVLQCHVQCVAGEVPSIKTNTLDSLQSCCWLVTVQFSIGETMKDFGLTGTPCAGASVPSLAYNGIIPGPLVDRTQ